MSQTKCKGIRKDGSPCQGNGLDQFDGLCIAHGPAPHQAHQWRSLGGKNCATAARIDKRIPERLKDMLDTLDHGMKQVMDGTLSPSAYTAVCRGVKMRLEVYRQADSDMDHIRTEETHAAAAAVAGAHGNLNILEAAAEIVEEQDQFRAESLVEQGLAYPDNPLDPDKPPTAVLNLDGILRFGYEFSPDRLQDEIDELKRNALQPTPQSPDLPDLLEELVDTGDVIEANLAGLEREIPPPLDPLTSQPFTELPARVELNMPDGSLVRKAEISPERMKDQLRQVRELTRKLQAIKHGRRPATEPNHPLPAQDAQDLQDSQPLPVQDAQDLQDSQPLPVQDTQDLQDPQPLPAQDAQDLQDPQPLPVQDAQDLQDPQPLPVQDAQDLQDPQPLPVQDAQDLQDPQPLPVQDAQDLQDPQPLLVQDTQDPQLAEFLAKHKQNRKYFIPGLDSGH